MGKSLKLASATAAKHREADAMKKALVIAKDVGWEIGDALRPGVTLEAATADMRDFRADLVKAGANANLMALVDGVISALNGEPPKPGEQL
jgi:hypothetical protein